MTQTRQILMLCGGVAVLGAAIIWAISIDVRRMHSLADAHGEHAEHAGHQHAEGEICEECLAEALSMAKAEAKTGGGGAGARTQTVEREVQMPQFTPVLPPAKGKRTLVRIATSMGEIEIVLFDDLTPRTVRNFLDLAGKDFYDGVIFHRVIEGFMIQTGDPEGTGRGGPGYTFADEFVSGLGHSQPGVVSMANRGPNTNGSQFFITVAPTPRLDGKHTVFGQVVKGMDVVLRINSVPANAAGRPLEDVTIQDVTVVATVLPGSRGEDHGHSH